MKRITLFLLLVAGFTVATAFRADETPAQAIPSVTIKTMDGKPFNTADIKNDGKPVIISFWATWCAPCKKELNEILDVYEEWQAETGVKMIAISIDDQRNSMKVKPQVESMGWPWEVYLDENRDFGRAMNVNNVPHTFVLNGKGEIVWQVASYNANAGVKMIHDAVLKAAGKQ
ncbi:MAG: TlpA family protein disulfide reductase [Bacteroidia bacterium]|jgi:thiol-disulfide isomerase/thioredoxin|nr:TlpA family protein disulfide reductase [Bacteroidia bacterium]